MKIYEVRIQYADSSSYEYYITLAKARESLISSNFVRIASDDADAGCYGATEVYKKKPYKHDDEISNLFEDSQLEGFIREIDVKD